jgi:hypothetical protein
MVFLVFLDLDTVFIWILVTFSKDISQVLKGYDVFSVVFVFLVYCIRLQYKETTFLLAEK